MIGDSRKVQRTITALLTVIILLISLSSTPPPTQASYPPAQVISERIGDVKFRGVVVDPSQYPMICPPLIFDVFFYCIYVQNVLSDPNNVLSGWSGPLTVTIGGMGGIHPNAEKVEIGDAVEVYASCSMHPARDPSIICGLSENYHYVRRISQQAVTITVTSTITSTVTSFTTITSNTVTSVTTFTTTRYTTGTMTTDVTRTYTYTRTVTITVTRTATTTTTITGPDVRMESLSSERQSYRPGEYIGLIMVFKNVGEAGYVNICYQINAQYLDDRWITRCRDLGFMNSGEERTIRDDNTVYAQCIVGGCTNQIIKARLSSVNNNPPIDPSERSTSVNVIIDDTITLEWTGPDTDYIIKDLRKNEVRSYHVYLVRGVPPVGSEILIELTIKRLDGGFWDWDEKVDVLLNHYQTAFDPGGLCNPDNEPLRIGTNKGWKRFEITMVKVDGAVIIVHPKITQTDFQRVQYIAEQGLKWPPWDNSFSIISKACCSD
jgi:hypothetical protein